MQGATLLLIGLLAAGGPNEYARSLDAKSLDQATLDTEGYGEKKAFKREDDGLRITLAPGETETGWKTPQQLKIGGNFTITANVLIKTLPKPAQEDGAAVGLAIAFQDITQPDLTLARVREPKGAEVYRSIDKGGANPMMMPGQPVPMMMFAQPGAPPPKPPRRTAPAAGDAIRLEIQREGNNIRLQVQDAVNGQSRYLGQLPLGANDVAAIKLFVANRNGAEPVNVLLRDLSIHADRITGLGTNVRTVFGTVVYAEPTSIENGVLIVGGQPKAPPPETPKPQGAQAPAAPGNTQPANKPGGGESAKANETKTAQTSATPAAPAPPAAPVAAPAPATPAAPTAGTVPATLPAQVFASAPGAPATPAPAKPPEPKAKIPLNELESIRFERTPALSGRFLGQVNLDFTKPGLSAKKDEPSDKKDDPKKENPAPKKDEAKKKDAGNDVLAPPPGTTGATKIARVHPEKNGIRDLNLQVAGLRNAEIKQVMVTCQTDKGPASWRLDTTDSQDWPLVIHRSGVEAWADLFLEPPQGDCFEKDFTVNITYADGQAANTTVKSKEHTDPKLAVDAKAPPAPSLDAWIHLLGDEKFFGKIGGISEDTLHLTTPAQDKLDVPLARITGIHFALLNRKEKPESFEKRLKTRGSEDVLLAQTKNGEVLAISGVLERTEDDRLHFLYQGKSRTLPLKQVEGLIMAARPDVKESDELRPTFSLPGGVVYSGRWKDLDTSSWKIETAWGQELKLPATEIQGVRFHGGIVTFLSDLNPSKVEETPFFSRRLPWRRDVGLLGEPLKMNGQTYDRGVAVHSRTVLTYDLNGRYGTFEALLGFDDAVQGKGRVDCRVFADDKEIYANPDLRADGPPVPLKLPVAGAEQLRLVVDFGQGQDTGDRVIWANARLYRPQEKAKAPATTSRRDPAQEPAKATERR